jgi:hypothetical protein
LTKALRWDIQALGIILAKAAESEELTRKGSSRANSKAQNEYEFQIVLRQIRKLLSRIEDAVPLINLAITTSGASLSTTLPSTISPSRLLQASTFLSAGDSQYSVQPQDFVQIGPAFTLSLYMLFSGHAFRAQDEERGFRDTTWKEVIHKARVKLCRVPLSAAYESSKAVDESHLNDERSFGESSATGTSFPVHVAGEARADEYAYQIVIIEDLDDDRVHTIEDSEEQPGLYEDVLLAGIRERVPIHEISKIFYADTGKILNIGSEGETNSPILLLKRDVNAIPPRRMMERSSREKQWFEEEFADDSTLDNDKSQSEIDAQLFGEEASSAPPLESELRKKRWQLPEDLDPEWLAFEVYAEEPDSDSEIDTSSPSVNSSNPARSSSIDLALKKSFSNLNLDSSPSPVTTPIGQSSRAMAATSILPLATTPAIRSSLSLLDLLIRLTSLQQFQQTSHLSIHDELLNFFLSDSATTGAGPDSELRRRKRAEARAKVGFDPYDESPVKVRTEGRYADEEDYEDGERWEQSPRVEAFKRSLGERGSSPSMFGAKDAGGLERVGEEKSPSTPLSAKGRAMKLKRDDGSRRGSPLVRPSVETDSTLSTSPADDDGTNPGQGKAL